MGLDDIDEDVAPVAVRRNTNPSSASNLDDLFGGLGVTVKATSQPVASVPVALPQSHDPLDSLFGPSQAAPRQVEKSDLFDFSQPVEVKLHKDGKTLLDLFENGGKSRVENRNTLSATATPSTSRVAAHFLSIMNFYDVLSVSRDADIDEIKRKYKKKALELHPDKAGASQTAEEAALFKMVTKAYETLSDSSKREEYDAQLRSNDQSPNWLQHV